VKGEGCRKNSLSFTTPYTLLPTPFLLCAFAPLRESLVSHPLITRVLILLVAAFALFGIYRLARLLTNKQVAVATVICTSLYPIFLNETLLAHREIIATALVIWGFYFYEAVSASHPESRRAASLVILIPVCALALGFAYQRTGHAEMTSPLLLFKAFAVRLWQVTGHMMLFVLTLCGLLAMTRPPLFDDGVERRRINLRVQIAAAFVIAAYVIAQSFTGSEAREMLPVIPLVMLIWISTLHRRVRRWRVVLGIVCAGFVLAFFVNHLF
jgi:hypothetical protein